MVIPPRVSDIGSNKVYKLLKSLYDLNQVNWRLVGNGMKNYPLCFSFVVLARHILITPYLLNTRHDQCCGMVIWFFLIFDGVRGVRLNPFMYLNLHL